MNTQDLRLIRRMAELMPIKDSIPSEKSQIDELDFSKVITFITTRDVLKEVAFYYLLHNKVIDYVKVFTAETIKDIYVNVHPDYKSFHEVSSPIIVILLGTELYNKQMITILNIFVDNFLREPHSKSLIFAFKGTQQEFLNKYKNASERGVLNSGKDIALIKVAPEKKIVVVDKPVQDKKNTTKSKTTNINFEV